MNVFGGRLLNVLSGHRSEETKANRVRGHRIRQKAPINNPKPLSHDNASLFLKLHNPARQLGRSRRESREGNSELLTRPGEPGPSRSLALSILGSMVGTPAQVVHYVPHIISLPTSFTSSTITRYNESSCVENI